MNGDNNKFSPVETAMLAVLADGLSHTPEELHACLWDEKGPISNIRAHLTYIRRKLRRVGQDIICEMQNRKTFYRQVRITASPYDGKR